MTVGPRHTTISADPRTAAAQNGENARDTLEVLRSKVTGELVTVEQYTATGSTSTRIRIRASARPIAVMLARCAKYYGQDEATAAYGTPNFVWDATTKSLDVFEPTGLANGTVYQLCYLVLEA